MYRLTILTVLSVVLFPSCAISQVVYDRAATAGESYARGASDVIRSRGETNLNNSQAAINMQDAYSMGLENSVKSVNAYWERRDIAEQRKAQKVYEIQKRRQRYLQRHGLKSLTSEEFDRTTGKINWPGPMNSPQFEEYRDQMSTVFEKRAQQGWLDGEDYLNANAIRKEWTDAINNVADNYPKNIVSQMRRFLLKLNRELNENLS